MVYRETDYNEVLQINEVFTNVSKGMVAKAEDLLVFKPIKDKKQIIMEILNKGEL
jgi:ribosome maturation protein SDO1